MRRLWLNLIGEDKQQMAKSRSASSTCLAACADIYRARQIAPHVLRDKTPVRRLLPVFKQALTATTEQKNQGRQLLACFLQSRLMRTWPD
jgi:hypothetical protein